LIRDLHDPPRGRQRPALSMTAETALIAPDRQARRGQVHPPAAIVGGSEGEILPLGASWIEAEQADNFSLHTKHAESVLLLLFSEDDIDRRLLEFRLDPRVNKTWVMWHCLLVEAERRS